MHLHISHVGTGALVGLRAPDGSHLLAEQIDASPLTPGQRVQGSLDGLGMHAFTDASDGREYRFFVLAYGLSAEAVQYEVG